MTDVREAEDKDVTELVRVINRAYRVEDAFLFGDRTDAAAVRALLAEDTFLVIDAPDGGVLVAAVHVALRGERGYFGMLAVDPAEQGHGLARRLIGAAEDYAKSHGCHAMDIHVLSLRTELPPLYRKFGYETIGTRPFQASFRPGYESHVLVMSKPL